MSNSNTQSKYEDILQSIVPEEFYGPYLDNPKRHRDEITACCPLHEDKTPSFGFNTISGRYFCHGCQAKGHFTDFIMALHGIERDQAIQFIRDTYGGLPIVPRPATKPEPPPEKAKLNPSLADSAHAALLQDQKLMGYLREHRGLTDATIDRFNIGAERRRFTIPVYDSDGDLVNIRSYMPKVSGDTPKMLNFSGFGEARLFPMPFPDSDEVLICEGELDTMLAIQHGYNAITGTAGCSTWKDEWSPLFAGKIVTIAYDNDEAGCSGAVRVAESIASYAAGVRILKWSDTFKPHGDITDFFVLGGWAKRDLDEVVGRSEEYLSVSSLTLPKSLKGILPKDGFIRSYLSYATGMTDASPEYHLACALSILSAAIGNKVKFYGHAGRQYKLNLWTVLLGSSGDRKSTAIDMARDILSQAVPDCNLPDQYSAESLLKEMAPKPCALLHHDEFSRLLALSKREYMGGFIATLTELYEIHGDYTYTTIKGGPITVRDPALSILAASTLDWLVEQVDDGVIKGGFMPRFLFWPGGARAGRKGLPGRPDGLIKMALVDFVRQVAGLNGIAEIDDDVRARYDVWDAIHEAQVEAAHCSHQLRAFYKRMPTYLLKLAVLYQVSFNKSITVTLEALEQAIRTIEYIKYNLSQLVDEEFTTEKGYKGIHKIFSLISEYPYGIDYARLLRLSKMGSFELEKILTTLANSDRITVRTEKSGDGKLRKIYCIKG